MDTFDGCTAVVTGAASGIGFGVAQALADDGANVVLADLDTEGLAAAVDALTGGSPEGSLPGGRRAIGVPTDVRDGESVQALADRTFEVFGSVHFLMNNAGVFVGGTAWEATDDDWKWLWDVNVGGIINGIRAFVPRMLAGDEAGHIVNTASIGGLSATPLSAAYCTTKFAAVGLTESLQQDLALTEGCKLSVSVVCPSVVDTHIADEDRFRPPEVADGYLGENHEVVRLGLLDAMAADTGLSPTDAGERILAEVKQGNYYVATHDSFTRLIGNHNDDRVNQRPPRFQIPD